MTVYAVIFYLLAAVILVATGLAATRRNLVHAVVYLVVSFFGSAMLFYLLGAPLLAALEVIIYAGAIMVLFLFIIMMLEAGDPRETLFPARQLVPAALCGLVYLVAGTVLLAVDPDASAPLEAAVALPVRFGEFVFRRHWLAVEIVSLLLLIAMVGALYIGRPPRRAGAPGEEEET